MEPDVSQPDNPFAYECGKCSRLLQVHKIIGRRAKCDDDTFSDFEVWQVVDAKRALGHKINPTMAFAAHKSREESDWANADRR